MQVIVQVAGLLKEGEVLYPVEGGVPGVRGEVINFDDPDVFAELRKWESVVDGTPSVAWMELMDVLMSFTPNCKIISPDQ